MRMVSLTGFTVVIAWSSCSQQYSSFSSLTETTYCENRWTSISRKLLKMFWGWGPVILETRDHLIHRINHNMSHSLPCMRMYSRPWGALCTTTLKPPDGLNDQWIPVWLFSGSGVRPEILWYFDVNVELMRQFEHLETQEVLTCTTRNI